jgi:error-prone DNA polymerase
MPISLIRHCGSNTIILPNFFAALLSNQPMGYYPVRVLLDDAKRSGVGIFPVDVNRSCERYVVENGKIRVSLLQLKGMSAKTVEAIISERPDVNSIQLTISF